MDFNMAYWVGFGFTFFLAMVVVFVYESTERVDILNEDVFHQVYYFTSSCYVLVFGCPHSNINWASLRSGKTSNILS